MTYGVAFTMNLHGQLRNHLLREPGQEDLCFAIWYPSRGATRLSALVHEVIMPSEGDRLLHGNASVTPQYFDRALKFAAQKKAGLVFFHSHTGPGWQGMSEDDIETERSMAAQTMAATGLPLVGMTVGTDEAWSARFWEKTAPKKYERRWCKSVRVVSGSLEVTFADKLAPPPKFRTELDRTISVWGLEKQQKLARLRIGVVGVGSVGSIVAEMLARMGIEEVTLIDFDMVEQHNLDRLLHAASEDYVSKRLKVAVLEKALAKSATAEKFNLRPVPYSVTEEEGFREALDCDILFSCVDRPWARYVLNLIAYAHLIPVVDGGIAVHTKRNGELRGADWQAHIACPTRRCLECLGQYDSGYIETERRGHLDDPSYIKSLPPNHVLKRNENVFPFSMNLASLEILQMLSMVISPVGISDVGMQTFHFVTGIMDVEHLGGCHNYCPFPSLIGLGDRCEIDATGEHPKAKAIRQAQLQQRLPLTHKIKKFIKSKILRK